MNKELEALREIQGKRCGYCPFNVEDMDGFECCECDENDDIVETALNRLGELEETNHLMFLREHKNTMKLKALEIIKEKQVDFYLVCESKDYEEYNIHLIETAWKSEYERRKLTYTDFKLLKECL